MAATALASTALMGVLVVGVVSWLAWRQGWYHYAPSVTGLAVGPREADTRLSEDPRALAVTFAVLLVGAVGGVVAYIAGPVDQQPMVGTAVALATGGVLAGYLLFGVYSAALSRGHPRSLAVAESATVAGALFLVAVTAQLVG
ncbi:hypothetical protein NDI56_15820 [Haloarcula sp. S1CR25-12]|uniref:DUF1761 domain-containing protein n=1 Tax=Haloarcula saliterrae TaxID=2950534 RepID=A0ABU2FF40_9EURY|nr:hypothetical protein [Haloarcula sp. S1CR25-12]MDS0260873.1 hypothetical protein [Haloarcula sp. S1CR25-12]